MRLIVTAVGRMKSGPDRDLAERYLDRTAKAGRSLGLKSIDIVEIAESRAARADDRMAEEAAALAKAIEPGAVRVVLDEHGTSLSSEDFAARLGRWRDGGRPTVGFMIGGADGLGPSARTGADLVLAFGAATWPHQLVRIMLLEQLYRAVTILAGHPYHRP
jgi:23S rRNA (pseudouridine1915-N3)-methyltransferase